MDAEAGGFVVGIDFITVSRRRVQNDISILEPWLASFHRCVGSLEYEGRDDWRRGACKKTLAGSRTRAPDRVSGCGSRS